MTISVSQSESFVAGNGVTTAFSFSFPTDTASDIIVSYINASGNQTTLLSTQYSITLNTLLPGQLWPSGGIVTYPLVGAPIAAGTSLLIQRNISLLQETSIRNQGNFYAQVTEEALDTLEMQLQQVAARGGIFRGIWQTGILYNYADIVVDGINGNNTNNLYLCALTNTSGTWSTDLAAGDWSLVLNVQAINAGFQALPITGGTITGNLTVLGNTTLGTTTLTNTTLTSATAASYRTTGGLSSSTINGLFLSVANTPAIAAAGVISAQFTSTGINATPIGATTPSTGAFTSGNFNSTLTATTPAIADISTKVPTTAFVKTNPTKTVLTSGTGTYTTPTGVLYLKVRLVGAGGGGAGSGSGAGTGGNGGNTTFGASLLTGTGGTGGASFAGGGGGGGATGGDVNIAGGGGSLGNNIANTSGGNGATIIFGGAGVGGSATSAGGAASSNTGAGGGGAGCGTQTASGQGGGAGGYVEKLITSPLATYAYAVGAAGTAGIAGTGSGVAIGGAGASGIIIIEEFYIG